MSRTPRPALLAGLAAPLALGALALAPASTLAAPVDTKAANAMLRSIPQAVGLINSATGCADPECQREMHNELVGWRNGLKNTGQMTVILRGRMSMCRWNGYNAWRSGATSVSFVANHVLRGENELAEKAAAKGKAAFARARGILATCR